MVMTEEIESGKKSATDPGSNVAQRVRKQSSLFQLAHIGIYSSVDMNCYFFQCTQAFFYYIFVFMLGVYLMGRTEEEREQLRKEQEKARNKSSVEYMNDIEKSLEKYCAENDVEDLKTASQSIFVAGLMYTQRIVFPNPETLRDYKYIHTNKAPANAFNYRLLNTIADIYIYLCYKYDKIINPNGFSKLTGIDFTTIRQWGNPDNRLSQESFLVYQKIVAERQESLSNKLTAAKSNPVGILAILNHLHGWNLPGVSREIAPRRALTAEELPKLGAREGEKENFIDVSYCEAPEKETG